MRNQHTLMTLTVLLCGVIMVAAGCSSDDGTKGEGIVERVIDSVTLTIVDELSEVRLASEHEDTVAPANKPVRDGREFFSDLVVEGETVYALFDSGLVSCDLSERTYTEIAAGERYGAIVRHNGELYVGGEQLYRLDGATLIPTGERFDGTVTGLLSYGDNLVIGTDRGLHFLSVVGLATLMENVNVSALVSDGMGLWVGTEGQGLFRWDGTDFRKRYLSRDSSLFDYVATLAFGHDHLYVGTPNGLFVHDGGSWQPFTIADGLPSENVLSVDASGWVVYVGTAAGVVSLFDGNIKSVPPLGSRGATVLRRAGRRLIVGTEFDGLLVRSGDVVTTLVPPEPDEKEAVISLAQ